MDPDGDYDAPAAKPMKMGKSAKPMPAKGGARNPHGIGAGAPCPGGTAGC